VQARYSGGFAFDGYGRRVTQCEARIRDRDEWGFGFGDYGRQCSRGSDGHVCGVELCQQHRRMVTQWRDGQEMLADHAAHRFAQWGVESSAPFIPEYDQLGLPMLVSVA